MLCGKNLLTGATDDNEKQHDRLSFGFLRLSKPIRSWIAEKADGVGLALSFIYRTDLLDGTYLLLTMSVMINQGRLSLPSSTVMMKRENRRRRLGRAELFYRLLLTPMDFGNYSEDIAFNLYRALLKSSARASRVMPEPPMQGW